MKPDEQARELLKLCQWLPAEERACVLELVRSLGALSAALQESMQLPLGRELAA